MELKVRNFAKIAEADIIIDGITIIAGNNNTGKSTIGKILDAIFNTTINIGEKMNKARVNLLSEALQKELEQILAREASYFSIRYDMQLSVRKFAEELVEGKNGSDDLCRRYLRSLEISLDSTEEDQAIERFRSLLAEIGQISERSLSEAIYTNYFGDIFHKQINSVYHREKEAAVTLLIKGKKIQLEFKNDECVNCVRELGISNTSLYIDDPFVLDELNNRLFLFTSDESMHQRNIVQKLTATKEKGIEERALSELLMNRRLEEIVELMNKVVAGKVLRRQKYMYQMEGDITKELDVASLSTGLKSFVIIKQLLLNGALNEKDVIVLDEPEIHLHPEWQLIYAELIILLQKKFDFHIIVTTHSSHFMEALELFAKRYGLFNRCNYYLADVKEHGAYFENVTDDLSRIYKQMVDPTLLLSRLREELETEDDEL